MRAGRHSKLNISQEKEIIKLYCEEKISTNKISKKYNVSPETIANYLRKNEIILRSNHETLKLLTKFTFTEMTEDKAFLLGLIYGDGSMCNRKKYINITSRDIDLLEKAQNIFGNKFKITKVKHKTYFRGVIYSSKLWNELHNLFALTNNKSDKLIFPIMNKKFIPFFLSGYVATDGCIRVKKQDNSLGLHFYSCSQNYLISISSFLCQEINIPIYKVYERKNIKGHFGKKPLYTLSFNGKKAQKTCEYIFANTSPSTRSDRKFAIYDNFISSPKSMTYFY